MRAGQRSTPTVDRFGVWRVSKWDCAFSQVGLVHRVPLDDPNFDDTADRRVGSDSAVTASLTKLLALQFSYLVRYRNQPIEIAETSRGKRPTPPPRCRWS